MITLKPNEYAERLLDCYRVKQPLFIQGSYGIGKSAIPRQVFSQVALEQKKEYVEWCDADTALKEKCIQNPDDYFVLYDARTSQMDTTALQGIPNMSRTDRLENIPYSWVVYFTQPKAHGVIFFDEINLAAPIVQSITYSAILDRVICDRRLADDVYVFAAGNRMKDRGHTFEMAKPLKDRFAECELKTNADEWIDWARKNKVNPHLIAFIAWNNSYLDTTENEKLQGDKPVTPRGVTRASTLIRGLDFIKDCEKIHQLIAMAVGEAFSGVFQGYCTSYAELDWKKIFEDPASVSELKISHQCAVAGGLTDMYQKEEYSADMFEKIMRVVTADKGLKKDLAIYTIRSMKDFDAARFGEHSRNINDEDGKTYGSIIVRKYGKFIL